jgi:hypothetical protein
MFSKDLLRAQASFLNKKSTSAEQQSYSTLGLGCKVTNAPSSYYRLSKPLTILGSSSFSSIVKFFSMPLILGSFNVSLHKVTIT